MRFAEAPWRFIALAALCAGIAGCAALPPEPVQAPPAATVPAVPPAAMPAPAAEAAPVKSEAEPAVSAAARRAFDSARQALAAGRTQEAERGFLALAQSNPDLGGPHANLGIIYRQAGKLAESVAQLEQAVRAGPQQPAYFNQLGISYRQQGQFAKAREAYEKAIELDASYAAPILNLGILHDLYLRDGQRALELYDRYLALPPAKDAAMVTKWVADLKNRKPEKTLLSKKEQP